MEEITLAYYYNDCFKVTLDVEAAGWDTDRILCPECAQKREEKERNE